jgi:hypothetical protein
MLGELLRVVSLAAATQDESVVSYDDPERIDSSAQLPAELSFDFCDLAGRRNRGCRHVGFALYSGC